VILQSAGIGPTRPLPSVPAKATAAGENARDVRKVKFKLGDKRAALMDIAKLFGWITERRENKIVNEFQWFCGALSAQIASSCALRSGRHAGTLADDGVSSELFPGLLIERCCPAQTVVLLELTEGPLHLRAQDAIKRSFIKSPIAKFDLCPANAVFPEGVASQRPIRSLGGRRFSCRVHRVACVGRIIQSGAADTQSQY
jgi:hypothetical protein